jgi:hypothetical protein
MLPVVDSSSYYFSLQDALYDQFLKEGKFPGESVIVPKRYNDLIMWTFWLIVTSVPLFKYIGGILLSGSWLSIGIFFGVIAVGK